MLPIETIARPVRNRISIPVPSEYASCPFQVILIPLSPEGGKVRTVGKVSGLEFQNKDEDLFSDDSNTWEAYEKETCLLLDTCALPAQRQVHALGVKTADAIHLACAESAGCDWFFTVDMGILKKVSGIGSMRVANPIQFIEEME